jgi:hypothetical protein
MKAVSWKLSEKINGKEVACGCVVDAFSYIKMCSKHEKEFRDLHEEAQVDYKRLCAEFDAGVEKREAATTI